MSIDKARAYLKKWNKDGEIREFEVSSATVALAARALAVEEGRIAKSLSFLLTDKPILIVAAGDARVDNRKFKELFGCKAKMMSPAEVNGLIGHEVGGVCPFGINAGVEVYLDGSLKRFATVFPACGSGNSAIEMSCAELAEIADSRGWIDVCRTMEQPAAEGHIAASV